MDMKIHMLVFIFIVSSYTVDLKPKTKMEIQ
jgi:hypothetical protein